MNGEIATACFAGFAMTVLLREIATACFAGFAMTRDGDGARVGAGEKLVEHSTTYRHRSPRRRTFVFAHSGDDDHGVIVDDDTQHCVLQIRIERYTVSTKTIGSTLAAGTGVSTRLKHSNFRVFFCTSGLPFAAKG